MPFSRLIAERELVGPDMRSGRLGATAVLWKLYDPATATLGAIPNLSGPLTVGLEEVGIYPDDPTDPAEDCFAAVDAARLADPKARARMLDYAELRALENCRGNVDETDAQLGTDNQQWARYATALDARIAALRAAIAGRYPSDAPPATLGSIDLGFAGECWW